VSAPGDLLQRIPAEFTVAAAIGIGSIILVSLVLFHGMGLHWVISFHKRGELKLRVGPPHIFTATLLFGVSIFFLLSLHIVGVVLWAVTLSRLGLIRTAADAIYFCANAYTTLGYGQVDLDPHYRIISPIIGISGLFTFAWTTSTLVNIVRDHNALLEQLHTERSEQKQLRENLWLAVRDVRARESEAERNARARNGEKSAGVPFFDRWQLWREERRALRAIRTGAIIQAKNLYRQEREAEGKLGAVASNPGAPPPAGASPTAIPSGAAPTPAAPSAAAEPSAPAAATKKETHKN
jgi:hypothetical protein